MRSRRSRRQVSNGSVLFLFIGVALTVVLALVVFSQSDATRTAVGEFPSLAPDIASVLPSGAAFDEESVKEVLRGPSAPPVFVVGYARPHGSGVAVVAWDGARGRYVASSVVALTFREGRVDGIPEIEVAPTVDPQRSVVLARGSSGVSRESAFVLAAENGVIRSAPFAAEAGSEPSVFHSGPLLAVSEEPSLEDLDGDGSPEVVIAARGAGKNGEPVTSRRAYAWKNGVFVLDEELTWALDTTTRLFPEPEATTSR